ncbi:MAG: GTPase Era [Oscillospiraceae bacterium]|jgi:GTP-binding protein Era|nr:GTPase Era [Oscillospiraceae bacterium]
MPETKSVFTAIVGKPNVGKSSLLNRIIGEKLAIVTAKPQTTRSRISGIYTRGETQFVFIDTPGMHKAKNRLGEFMVKQARESVSDVDAAFMLVEPQGEINQAERELMSGFKKSGVPAVLVINKIDLLRDKSPLLKRIDEFRRIHDFAAYIPISVRENDGIDLLLTEAEKYARPGPHYFDAGAFTDQPEKALVSEMIREKTLINLRDEVPHGIGVIVEKMNERAGRSGENILDIDAVIYCERKNHKSMIIGKGGAMLKKIAGEARADIEKFFELKVNLQVWVKIKEDWRNQAGIMRSLGYGL